jgi:hypothetical protein
MHALVSVGARLPRRRQWVGALRRLLTAGGGATAGNDFKSLAEHQRSHWTFMIGCLHLSSLTPRSSRSLEENSLSVKTRREGASLEAADVERAGAARPNRCNKHPWGWRGRLGGRDPAAAAGRLVPSRPSEEFGLLNSGALIKKAPKPVVRVRDAQSLEAGP